MTSADFPLYRGVDRALAALTGASSAAMPTALQPGMHAGLWYDKLYRALPGKDKGKGKGNGKGDGDGEGEKKARWIATVTEHPVGDRERLAEFVGRRRLMVESLGGRLLYAEATTRFVTGLGRAHPVENGFAWHHTLATPYLPGSGLKGVVRTWARERGISTERIEALLGVGPRPDDGGHRSDPAGHVGGVHILDAVPVEPARLETDVMTPHQSPYYQRQEIPGDWHSPIPIPFLTAAPELTLQIGVLARAGQGDDGAVSEVSAWIVEALAELGAGAKTAVGYGRFRVSERDDVAADWVAELRARRRAQGSPLDRARDDVADLSEQGALDLVRVLSQGQGEHTPEQRQALRQALREAWLDTWTGKGMGGVGKKKRRAYLGWLAGES
ncbi:type III-B CRISPR module RAMP protein Cmr6 [Haliangium sp.]|uniref:type III-B CRISPR module RAMP protein Cmr6 n=1 Tax=Haliangium sp. TaxID=2663208 RepID=UPI003D14B67F